MGSCILEGDDENLGQTKGTCESGESKKTTRDGITRHICADKPNDSDILMINGGPAVFSDGVDQRSAEKHSCQSQVQAPIVQAQANKNKDSLQSFNVQRRAADKQAEKPMALLDLPNMENDDADILSDAYPTDSSSVISNESSHQRLKSFSSRNWVIPVTPPRPPRKAFIPSKPISRQSSGVSVEVDMHGEQIFYDGIFPDEVEDWDGDNTSVESI
mmetsp:Transcript_49364/g.96524  ORF Transcript_49364/g.96524 Transcript_49364/m.96524 type:complete len:216 (-) Transcript_49364:317-964(-)